MMLREELKNPDDCEPLPALPAVVVVVVVVGTVPSVTNTLTMAVLDKLPSAPSVAVAVRVYVITVGVAVSCIFPLESMSNSVAPVNE